MKQSRAEGNGRAPDAEPPKLTVLLADPDSLARRALRQALDRDPALAIVGEAAVIDRAVELAYSERPDIVLMDADLDEDDPVAAVRPILRASPTTAVIVLSVRPDEARGIELLRAGASGFLAKDISTEALPRVLLAVGAGEIAISRRLVTRVVARLRSVPITLAGLRPVASTLTDREWDVIDYVRAGGRRTETIAAEMGLAPSTIRRHLRAALRKLDAKTTDEAVEIARRQCLWAAGVLTELDDDGEPELGDG
ncbi:MAG TPA: response regulator transcription factor [Solirubrobacteraceae bacterium]|nr:response regulator transcription factor [Solirubrobacteraceae bacterium]